MLCALKDHGLHSRQAGRQAVTIFKDTWKMHKNVDNKIMNSIATFASHFSMLGFSLYGSQIFTPQTCVFQFHFISFSWFRSYILACHSIRMYSFVIVLFLPAAFSIILQYKVVKRSIKWMCSIFRNWDCGYIISCCVCVDSTSTLFASV